MTEVNLRIGGQSVVFIVTDYHPGSPATWDEPEEPPYIEWYADNVLVDAIINEFSIGERIEDLLMEAIKKGMMESKLDAAIERLEESCV